MKNLNSHKIRSMFMLGGVAAMMGITMMAPHAARADEAQNYKYGATVLGVLGAVLAIKGKTLPAVIAGAGAYYAYNKGADIQQNERYGNYDSNGYYGNSYDNSNRYGNYDSNGYYRNSSDNSNRSDNDDSNSYSGNRYDNSNRSDNDDSNSYNGNRYDNNGRYNSNDNRYNSNNSYGNSYNNGNNGYRQNDNRDNRNYNRSYSVR